jgi:hypothetical protein
MILFFDAIAAFMVLLSLYKCPKNKNWWALYSAGCLIFIFVFLGRELYSASILNIFGVYIGMKNYLR